MRCSWTLQQELREKVKKEAEGKEEDEKYKKKNKKQGFFLYSQEKKE